MAVAVTSWVCATRMACARAASVRAVSRSPSWVQARRLHPQPPVVDGAGLVPQQCLTQQPKRGPRLVRLQQGCRGRQAGRRPVGRVGASPIRVISCSVLEVSSRALTAATMTKATACGG
jgi:hypothetical protein